MIEWARNNEPTHSSRDEFIWHQLLLSLLYDEVLAQDETVIISKRMAKWFSTPSDFETLTKVAECGGLSLLKRPLHRYPREFHDRALIQPVRARREYLEKFSVDNQGQPVRFTDHQLLFQERLEVLLRDRPSIHRFAGERRSPGANIMSEFASLLREVLTDTRYQAWLTHSFPQLTPVEASEFVQAMESPDQLVDRLRAHDLVIADRFSDPHFTPVFDTATAMQLAATFPGPVAAEFQELVETVFARPYCQEEGSDGRYGRKLRDLPLVSEIGDDGRLNELHVVQIKTTILHLPKPSTDMPGIINSMREKPSGRRLRRTMRRLGLDPTYESATQAWRDVADDLASTLASTDLKEITIKTLVAESPRGVVYGVLAGLAAAPLAGHGSPSILETGIGAGLGSGLDVLGNLFGRSIKYGIKRNQVTDPLRRAVQFSCVPHPVVAPKATG